MKVYFAADHAGFELKNTLLAYVRDELGYEVEDCGAYAYDESDDYPDVVTKAAKAVVEDAGSFGIVLGGSGQGEAMTANRVKGVRAAVYYGHAGVKQTDVDGAELDVLTSSRIHNDANVLSLGARFLEEVEAKEAVKIWLETAFSGDERHVRRIHKLDELS